MSLKENLFTLWKHKGQIMEGIKNSIFKREDVEEIVAVRNSICTTCDTYDPQGDGCMVAGTGPCCDNRKGGCGCSLGFKQRSLSSACPKGHWEAMMTQEEEDALRIKLGM